MMRSRYMLWLQRLAGATLLVFANKQDLPGALSAKDIREVSDKPGTPEVHYCIITIYVVCDGELWIVPGWKWADFPSVMISSNIFCYHFTFMPELCIRINKVLTITLYLKAITTRLYLLGHNMPCYLQATLLIVQLIMVLNPSNHFAHISRCKALTN